MELTISQDVLAKALADCEAPTKRKQPSPILNCVLLEADHAGLTLKTNNCDMGIEITAEAEVFQPGKTILNHDKFFKAINELNNGEVKIALKDDKCLIEQGKTKYKLATITELDSFPSFSPWPETPGVELNGAILKLLLSKVKFAVETELTQDIKRHVLLKYQNAQVGMVGLSSFRLALASVAIPDESRPEEQHILPDRLVSSLGAFLPDESIYFTTDNNLLFFKRKDGAVLTHRKVNGSFPNYLIIIPGSPQCKAKPNDRITAISTRQISSLLRRALLGTDEGSKGIFLRFKPNSVEQSSASSAAEVEDQTQIQYDGPEQLIKLNGQFIVDYFEHVTAEDVTIAWQDQDTQKQWPITLKAVDTLKIGDAEYTCDHRYVLMPMTP